MAANAGLFAVQMPLLEAGDVAAVEARVDCLIALLADIKLF